MTNPATAWSFSAYKTWLQCPLKYKLQNLDKLAKASSPQLERGNAIHVKLAHFIEGKDATLPQEVQSEFHQNLYGWMRTWPDKLVEQQWGFTSAWRQTGWFAKDTWFRAVLDVGLFYDDNTVEVIDHKTGKKYDDNTDQMEVFAAAVASKFPGRTAKVTTRLIYIDAFEQEIAEFTHDDAMKLRAKWTEKAQQMLADREWLPRQNNMCRFCEFGQSKMGICRFGG